MSSISHTIILCLGSNLVSIFPVWSWGGCNVGPSKGQKLKTHVFLIICQHQQPGQTNVGFFCSFCPCLLREYLRDCGIHQQGTPYWKAPLAAVISDFCSCLQEGDVFVNVQDGSQQCCPVSGGVHAVKERIVAGGLVYVFPSGPCFTSHLCNVQEWKCRLWKSLALIQR